MEDEEVDALTALLAEAPARVDRLGFAASVHQAAKTLRPLVARGSTVVVAVSGALGTGKSSFLEQLRDALALGEIVDVRFNAQLPSGGSMWHGLVTQIGRALYEDLRKRLSLKQPVVVCGREITEPPPDARSHWRDFAWWLVEKGVPADAQRHALALFADVPARLPGRGLTKRRAARIMAGVGVQAAAQTATAAGGLGASTAAGSASEARDAAGGLVDSLWAIQPTIPVSSEEFLTCLNELIGLLLPRGRRLVLTIEDVARLDDAGRRAFEHTLGFIHGLEGAVVFLADDTMGARAHAAAQLSPGTGEAFSTRAIDVRVSVPLIRVAAAAAFVDEFNQHTHANAALKVGLREVVPALLLKCHALTPRILKRTLRFAWVMLRLGESQANGEWDRALSKDPVVAAKRADCVAYFLTLLALDGTLEAGVPAAEWARCAEQYPDFMLWLPWSVWDGAEWAEGPVEGPHRKLLERDFPRSITRARWLLFLGSLRGGELSWIERQRRSLGEALVEEAATFMRSARKEASNEEDLLEVLTLLVKESPRRLNQVAFAVRSMHHLAAEPTSLKVSDVADEFDHILFPDLLVPTPFARQALEMLARSRSAD